jgi:hypothetical protein
VTTAEELTQMADQLTRASEVKGIVPDSVVIRVKDPASLIELMRRAAKELNEWE